MANIPMKTLRLHGLDDTYTIPTAPEHIGAAPAGYGLGGTARENAPLIKPEDLDSTVRNGWYPYYDSNYIALAGLSFSGGIFVVNRYVGAVQYFFPRGDEFVGTYAVRSQKNSGEWTEWEVENPPMELGVEYRTTERWDGKVVYTMLVNCGEMTNNTSVTFAENVTTIRYAGFAGGVPLPSISSDGLSGTWTLWMKVNGGKITLYAGSGYSSTTVSAKAQVWYTKD